MRTFFENAIVTADTDIGVLFSPRSEKFLFRRRPPATATLLTLNKEADIPFPAGPDSVHEDVLIRLPAVLEPKGKFIVLQRWTGRVTHVSADTFLAVLADTLDLARPLEEAELDISEVSPSDCGLLVEGATFYWSIGYRDSPDGQRDRLSTIRFARLPPLTDSAVARAFKEADLVASLFESE